MVVAGEYLAVEPPNRLVFTWKWDGETDETLVSVELTPNDAGTELVRPRRNARGDENARIGCGRASLIVSRFLRV